MLHAWASVRDSQASAPTRRGHPSRPETPALFCRPGAVIAPAMTTHALAARSTPSPFEKQTVGHKHILAVSPRIPRAATHPMAGRHAPGFPIACKARSALATVNNQWTTE
jgi:hypothetical protein